MSGSKLYEQSTITNLTTFNSVVISNAEKTPNKSAYIQLDNHGEEIQRISYATLILNSLRISEQLLEKNKKGDRCLIMIPGGIEFITAFLGCVFAGIIAVPTITPKRNKPNSRFCSILADSNPNCILTTDDTRELAEIQVNSLGGKTNVKSIIVVKISDSENYTLELPNISPADIAFLQYSSGSIGNPKGIMVTQKNLVHNSQIIKQSFNHTKDLVVVTWLPPFHDMGLIGCMLQPLFVGGTCVIIQPTSFIRNPAMWFEAISKYKGTTVGCPNFALDYCVDKITTPDVDTMDLSSLNVLFCGSEPVRKNTLQNFKKTFKTLNFNPNMFLPCYGLAEATLMVTGISQKEEPEFYRTQLAGMEIDNTADNGDEEKKSFWYTSCGYTWNNTDLKVVDPTTKLELPETQIGEIWVKNDSVCNGYWNKPEETKEIFNAHLANNNSGPYLRTGDMGFCDKNHVYITGRLKELIIIRGLNIFPNDIENIIDKSHRALQPNSCAVFSVEKGNREELVVVQEIKRMFVNDHDRDEIFASVIESISRNFDIRPYSIVIISPMSLPKTTSGKIKRLECKKRYLENKLKVVTSWESADNEVENTLDDTDMASSEQIITWIKNWLGNKLHIDPEQIDPEQPIPSFGLDSIGAVELESAINEKFDLDIFVGDFLENNSLNYLVEVGIINKYVATE